MNTAPMPEIDALQPIDRDLCTHQMQNLIELAIRLIDARQEGTARIRPSGRDLAFAKRIDLDQRFQVINSIVASS
jgi:hypothetical protein